MVSGAIQVLAGRIVRLEDEIKRLQAKVILWHLYPQEKPSESREYLVWIMSPSGAQCFCIFKWFGDDHWGEDSHLITAWQELPKPHKEDDDV